MHSPGNTGFDGVGGRRQGLLGLHLGNGLSYKTLRYDVRSHKGAGTVNNKASAWGKLLVRVGDACAVEYW